MKTLAIFGAAVAAALSFSTAHAQTTPHMVKIGTEACASQQTVKAAVRIINDIPAFKTDNVEIVDWQTPTFISIEPHKSRLVCKMNVVLSNSHQATFKLTIKPAPFHKNQLVMLARQIPAYPGN